jgi:glycosyltransferase involved in cell wall biosynthesis
MEQPLVSVFLPTYNHIRYIDDAVNGLVEQNYDRLEIVVGDDGSTDGTRDRVLDLARRWPGRVIPIADGVHLGINGNCNRTLAACRGKYVIFAAGDDLFLPGKVKAQIDWLEADERRVMCGHAVEHFDSESGKSLGIATGPAGLHSGAGAHNLVANVGLFPGLSLAVRRSALPAQGFDSRVEVVSDWKLQIDTLAGGGHYGFVDGVFARSRVHPDSISYQVVREREMHRACFDGFMLTLALVEAEWPHLMSACFRARGVVLFTEARWHQKLGDARNARRYFVHAFRHGVRAKSLAGLAMTVMPRPLTESIDAGARSFRR